MSGAVLDVDQIVDTVVGLLETDADVPSMTLTPRPPERPHLRAGLGFDSPAELRRALDQRARRKSTPTF